MKGLIVAAGYGTRFLPATKTVPKEMLPLIDKPSIAFVIEEFLSAGIEDIVILTSRRKKSLEDYLDREVELESVFLREGKKDKLELIKPYPANFAFIHQREMRGTGHALLQARPLLEQGPFVVAYPDDLHFGTPPLAGQLIQMYEKTKASVIATMHAPPNLHRYGVLELDTDNFHVRDIIEKPEPGTEPSQEASVGRFLYTPDIFPFLEEGWRQHSGEGEYYHVYALKKLMDQGKVVHMQMEGERLDIGTPEGYMEALLKYAAGIPELRKILDRVYGELNGK